VSKLSAGGMKDKYSKSYIEDKKYHATYARRLLIGAVAVFGLGWYLANIFDRHNTIETIFLIITGFAGIAALLGFLGTVWTNTYYYAIQLKPKNSTYFQYLAIIIYPIILSLFFLQDAEEFRLSLFFKDFFTFHWFSIVVYSGATWAFINSGFDNRLFFKAFLIGAVVVFVFTTLAFYDIDLSSYEDYDPYYPTEEEIKYREFKLKHGLYTAFFLSRTIYIYLTIFAFSFFKKIKLGRIK